MAGKHKKGKHEEHVDESWLIPYADLLTLLLALFIVLFATSNVDSEKFEAVAQVFNDIYGVSAGGGMALTPGGGGKISLIESNLPMPPTAPPSDGSGGDGSGSEREAQLSELEDAFKTYILQNNLQEEITVEKSGGGDLQDGILITLTSDVLFDSGSAAINDHHRRVAVEIAGMIEESQKDRESFKVIVTGHTDNIPINTPQFRNNWYLSIARALNFMQVLMENSSLDPSYYSARGLGEYSPIDTNDTPEGRMHNRRVEVYISLE